MLQRRTFSLVRDILNTGLCVLTMVLEEQSRISTAKPKTKAPKVRPAAIQHLYPPYALLRKLNPSLSVKFALNLR